MFRDARQGALWGLRDVAVWGVRLRVRHYRQDNTRAYVPIGP